MLSPAAIPLDSHDPYAREAQTFPVLGPEQMARIAAYGHEAQVADGEMLFTRGQRGVDCLLILAGEIEILDIASDGSATVFTTHGAGQFTGEMDLFNNRQILVSGRARGTTRVIRLPRADFRRMIAAESDIAEIMMRAFILRRVALIRHAQGGVVLVGPAHGADTLRLQRFLTRNGYPHRLLDTEADPDAGGFLEGFAIAPDQLPVVIMPGAELLRRPATHALADALGITEALDPAQVHDLLVVGAGPAGLAAAVYGASEGLRTIVIEGVAPGGQAGTSSKIENYLGFPTGISGQALAGRAQAQAQKFGARLAISRSATAIDCSRRPFVVQLEDGQAVQARSIVIASGATYRRLTVPGYDRYEGAGIHYAATAMEGALCSNEEVVVVGGGNSAGQAAVFLSGLARHVHIMVRADGLAATMSDYLVQRIHQSPAITLHTRTEITALEGDDRLRSVTWTHADTGASETRAVGNVFVMIGAAPNTGWLGGCVALDEKGFVLTGLDGASAYETSVPGMFAVGDVRSGSVKRVASGVGEGSVVVAAVHRFLDPALA